MFQAAMTELSESDQALLALLDVLAARGYRFVTPTPATHARVVARRDHWEAHDLAGALGWSLPFRREQIDERIVGLLETAEMLVEDGGLFRSRVRVSSLGSHLFLHSAYPTEAADSVFFGPDSYRFADFIAAELGDCAAGARFVDIGTGAGVGAVVAAGLCPEARLTVTDINIEALRFAQINSAHAGLEIERIACDGVSRVTGSIDVALANPPYIIDPSARAYRDGGGMRGAQVALDMATAAAGRLAPGGKLLLYSGSPIVGGHDDLLAALRRAVAAAGCDLCYREIDPDVFGEELEQPAYSEVDRIAVVGAVITKREVIRS